ncbi:MAG: hypothetical protein QNL92_11095 [Octadecabacter sp.]
MMMLNKGQQLEVQQAVAAITPQEREERLKAWLDELDFWGRTFRKNSRL